MTGIPTRSTEDLIQAANEQHRRSIEQYAAAIRPPANFYFTLEGTVTKIVADMREVERQLHASEIFIGGRGVDPRIGYLHQRTINVVLADGTNETVFYEGTPPEGLDGFVGLMTGAPVRLIGWEGQLVRAPSSLFNRASLPKHPQYGYVLDTRRPRRIHQIEVLSDKGSMIYGPKKFQYPQAPFDEFNDRTTPQFKTTP